MAREAALVASRCLDASEDGNLGSLKAILVKISVELCQEVQS